MWKQLIKRTPIVGALAIWLHENIRWTRRASYVCQRREISGTELPPAERSRRQIANLLDYTKTSGTAYSALQFPAGYHSIEVDGTLLAGQRDPRQRLSSVPFDFSGATVLDIGCNAGGMLFVLADRISSGVGIDHDTRMINASNRLRSMRAAHNLDFYVFDLEQEDLNIIRDFLPDGEVDIAFLLSMCMWLRNWEEVIDFAADVSTNLLFESNGTASQQEAQHRYLASRYQEVEMLSGASSDDPEQRRRRLYLCR